MENTSAEFCRGKVLEILPDWPTVLLSVASYWRGEGTYFDFLFPNMAKNVSHSFRHGARCSRRRRKKRSDRWKKPARCDAFRAHKLDSAVGASHRVQATWISLLRLPADSMDFKCFILLYFQSTDPSFTMKYHCVNVVMVFRPRQLFNNNIE